MAKATLGKPSSPEPTLPTHGAATLPSVEVECYSLELEDEEGYAGDKASRRAFVQILDDVRRALRKAGDEDPLGEKRSEEISKKKLGELLAEGDPEAGAVVQSAVEDFAQQLASVIRRFLRLKSWRDTECIVVGGGFRGGRIGELVIARTGIILKAEGIDLDLQLIHHDPDEAGLIGCAYLLPAWMVEGYEAMLAVDVGGTNIRAGVVKLNLDKAKDLSKARVAEMKLWRHAEEEDLARDEAIDQLVEMLQELLVYCEENRLRLAPVIGIGCPGKIRPDGSIESGAQNLPGNWESGKFNLPAILREQIPQIGEHETLVVMHNDAVVQGLSEIPYVKERLHWGALTIGTGLGNARFMNRHKARSKRSA